jgi:hypothetical protein
MAVKKRTRITIETERVLVISKARSTFDGWCPVCNQVVRLLRPDEATAFTAYFRASQYQYPLEISKLHIIPTADGLMSVCLNSLLSHGGIGTDGGLGHAKDQAKRLLDQMQTTVNRQSKYR